MDTLSLYMKQLANYERCSIEEERALSTKIQEYRKNHPSFDGLDENHEMTQILHRFMEGNYRLVVSIAKNYQNYGLPFIDIIQEGNMGLLEAVKRFDCTRGARFATFATFYIKQSINRALSSQVRFIRIPEYKLTQIRKLKRVIENTNQDFEGFLYDEDEISHMMEIDRTQIISLDREILANKGKTYSLHETIRDEHQNPHESYISTIEQALFDEAIMALEQQEHHIISLRWGLSDGKEWTYEKIAQLLHLSKEGVRKIEHRALAKMKAFFTQ